VAVLGVSVLDDHVLLGDAATATVRASRPQAMPALELRRSLERLEARTADDLPAPPLA
jgi:hypothetical protein